MSDFGPSIPISKELHASKYRQPGENFEECCGRIAAALATDHQERYLLLDMLLHQRFLPGGRIQASAGASVSSTCFNCFCSDTIEDSMYSFMNRMGEASEIMRRGGGIGFSFGNLRPQGDIITTIRGTASGPVKFMGVPNSIAGILSQSGNRRGALMGILPCTHPDIETFIHAKQNSDQLNNFNISVTVTDEFLWAVEYDTSFDLKFDGRVYKTVSAKALWDEIIRSSWNWAEPGILFIDTINRMNNLWYCEHISAVNPCAEQPLPPKGLCCLGSLNLTKYLVCSQNQHPFFDYNLFVADTKMAVRALDRVIDISTYPIEKHKEEELSKRRIGLGYTGLANTLEVLVYSYGSSDFLSMHQNIALTLRNTAYCKSIQLAREKESFPLYDERYLEGEFIKQLPEDIQDDIRQHGIRNSHLISVAPTGSISLTADNISSGIEPPYLIEGERIIRGDDGPEITTVQDWAYRVHGVRCKTANECSIDDHLNVLAMATKYSDSSVSKTVNVGDNVSYEDFRNLYMRAWKAGCKGLATFRASGKREGIMKPTKEGSACYIDSATGKRSCD